MYHCKVMIVDDIWVSVGSTNFDDRSFRLNAEANLNIYDAEFAKQLVKVFEVDKGQSRQMTRRVQEPIRAAETARRAGRPLRRQL